MGMGMGGLMGMAGGMMPAMMAGTAIAHMTGHHGGPRAAPGAVGDWQSLAICNAYPSKTPLTMVHWQGKFQKKSSPLLYKTCRSHDQVLADGDNFTFSLGDSTVGSFNVTSVMNRAIMVLVVGRDSQNATKASFISHTFRGNAPQSAALVDAYVGKGAGKAKVLDGNTSLDFFQEVALKPGAHMVSLNVTGEQAASGQVPMEVPSDAHAKYLLARVGYAGPAEKGEAFPQELVALPVPMKPVALPTPKPQQHSAAGPTRAPRLVLLSVLVGAARAVAGADR